MLEMSRTGVARFVPRVHDVGHSLGGESVGKSPRELAKMINAW